MAHQLPNTSESRLIALLYARHDTILPHIPPPPAGHTSQWTNPSPPSRHAHGAPVLPLLCPQTTHIYDAVVRTGGRSIHPREWPTPFQIHGGGLARHGQVGWSAVTAQHWHEAALSRHAANLDRHCAVFEPVAASGDDNRNGNGTNTNITATVSPPPCSSRLWSSFYSRTRPTVSHCPPGQRRLRNDESLFPTQIDSLESTSLPSSRPTHCVSNTHTTTAKQPDKVRYTTSMDVTASICYHCL